MTNYSLDLRIKVLNYLSNNNISQCSNIFSVSRPTIYSWISIKQTTGQYQRVRAVHIPKGIKIDYEELKDYVKLYPDLYLYEIAKHFNVSVNCIWLALKKLNISVKKKSTIQRKK
jgi:transposase